MKRVILALLLSSRSASAFCSHKHCFGLQFRLNLCLKLRTGSNPSSFLVLFCHQKHLESHLGRSRTHNLRWGTKQVPNFTNVFFFSPGSDQFAPCFGRRFGKFCFEVASVMMTSWNAQVSYFSSYLLSPSPSALHLLSTKTVTSTVQVLSDVMHQCMQNSSKLCYSVNAPI